MYKPAFRKKPKKLPENSPEPITRDIIRKKLISDNNADAERIKELSGKPEQPSLGFGPGYWAKGRRSTT